MRSPIFVCVLERIGTGSVLLVTLHRKKRKCTINEWTVSWGGRVPHVLLFSFIFVSKPVSRRGITPGSRLKKNLPLNQNYSNRLFQTSFGEVQDSDLPLIN